MALTPAQVRTRTATALGALPGWSESPRHPDLFPGDAGSWAHLSFAVVMPASTYDAPRDSSRIQRGAVGGLLRSEVRVRWTYRIRADRAVLDYADALAAELAAVKALTALAATGGLHVQIEQTTRTGVGDGGWLLGEIVCTMIHQSPIQ